MNRSKLQLGAKGTEVKDLQEKLAALGFYRSAVTSYFEDNTYRAVMAFQKANGLFVTGEADTVFFDALNRAAAKVQQPKITMEANKEVHKTDELFMEDKKEVRESDKLLFDKRPVLKRGASGTETYVAALERMLTLLGYYTGLIDGDFGIGVENAVKAFQRDYGLTVDGIVGPQTWAMLDDALGAPDEYAEFVPVMAAATLSAVRPVIRRGSQGDAVTELQELLTRLSYFDGPINGSFGPITEASVMAFQRNHGLTVDGIVGAMTWAAIDRAIEAITPQPPPAPEEFPTLRLGDTGDAVKLLQEMLTDLGYFFGSLDSVFGPMTQAAVIAFQQAHGLTADGIVGPMTWAALNEALANLPPPPQLPTLRLGDTGDAVALLQEMLTNLGYYAGSIDGIFGPQLDQAVRAFQSNQDLTVDGIVGPMTWNALESALEGIPPQPERPLLRPGDTGDAVVLLQDMLTKLGYYTGPIDGVFGPALEESVRAFQISHGLTVDGIVGPMTWTALDEAIEALPPSPPTPPPPPPPVEWNIINTAEELNAVRNSLSGNYKLGTDIDLTQYLYTESNGWLPIGTWLDSFSGHFDGNGHKIAGLWIDRPESDFVGLFGRIENGTVENLKVEIAAPGVSGKNQVGGLAGSIGRGTISNCHADGIVSGNDMVGGFIGYVGGSEYWIVNIENCSAEGEVNAAYTVGGLIGFSHTGGTIEKCFSTVNISNSNSVAGGLIGSASSGEIRNCYSTGDVSGNTSGGLVGSAGSNGHISIENCYSVGKVSGSTAGGFIGNNVDAAIAACFFDRETTGQSNGIGIGGSSGVAGKTTLQMKTESTFTDAGWGFDAVWAIDEGISYPYLRSNLPSVPPVAPPPPLPPPLPSERPILSLGDTGDYVVHLQELLAKLDYYTGPIDGVFDEAVEAAVKAFQIDYGVIGIVGPVTWDILERAAEAGGIAPPEPPPVEPPMPPEERPVLRLGAVGSAVESLQAMLTRLGYYTGPIDGYFDSGTDAAVRAFQRANGLTVDGVVGPLTWAALDEAIETAEENYPPLQQGDRGEAVLRLQMMLNQLGYGLATDGIFGPATAQAVRFFQASQGLPENGIMTPVTWRTLETALAYTRVDQFALCWSSNPQSFTVSTDAFEVISPVWFQVGQSSATGDITIDRGRANIAYTNAAHREGILIWGCIQSFTPSVTRALVTNSAKTELFIREVSEICAAYNLDGINIDFENMYVADRNIFTDFVRKLAGGVRAAGRERGKEITISIDVTPPPFPGDTNNMWSASVDRGPLGAICDYTCVMTYDEHGSWSEPGPVASTEWTRRGIVEMLRSVQAKKLLLGIPFYSIDWNGSRNAAGQITYSGVIYNLTMNMVENAINYGRYTDRSGREIVVKEWILRPVIERGQRNLIFIDTANVVHNIWGETPQTIIGKIDMMKEYGLIGICCWEYSFGNTAAFNAIRNNM